MNPAKPAIINGLRPKRSEAFAQKGEADAQRIADSEKMPTTISSASPIDRPIAGRTEIRPVFPSAVADDTQIMIATARFGRPIVGAGSLDDAETMPRGLFRALQVCKPEAPSTRN